jgi:hypothetical protein
MAHEGRRAEYSPYSLILRRRRRIPGCEVEHAVEDGDGDAGFDLLGRLWQRKVSPMMCLYHLIVPSAPVLAL